MSSPNADLIAVSLACSKDQKSPYRMGPPKLVMKAPGESKRLEKHYNSGPIKLAFLTFADVKT